MSRAAEYLADSEVGDDNKVYIYRAGTGVFDLKTWAEGYKIRVELDLIDHAIEKSKRNKGSVYMCAVYDELRRVQKAIIRRFKNGDCP